MNPLFLAAALLAIPLSPPAVGSAVTASASPVPADATRAVAFRLRVLSLPGDPPDGLALTPVAALTDAQVRTFVEAVQADRRGTILQAPTVTAAEGQAATVFTGHTRTFTTGIEAGRKDGEVVIEPKTKTVEVGVRVDLTGRIAADGKAVTARVKYTDTRVGEAVQGVSLTVQHTGADGLRRVGVVVIEAPDVNTATVETTVVLPAGRHVVIPGPVRMEDVRAEFGPPVLSRIPYVNRLFTNVAYGRVPVRTYLVLSAVVLEDELPVAPAPRAVGRR